MIQEIHITNLIYNITFISIILSVIPLHFVMNEWMNECLTTPQHEKQIGYWVSEKGKCMKWLYN